MHSDRRFFLTAVAGSLLLASRFSRSALAQPVTGSNEYGVKALFFDMFGTLVDWRTGVAREAEAHLKPRGYNLDWLAFADAWRAGYNPATEEVTSGRIPFAKLDVLHRKILDSILPRFNVKGLPEDVVRSLNLAWHRLDVWPDVSPSMPRLEKQFLLAPVSNGHIALTVDLDRRNHLHFDAILGAEIAHDYKPKPRIYLSAVEAFDLQPNECLMVSASGHTGDIKGAAAAGLRTASVARPDEYGPATQPSTPKTHADIVVGSLTELADKLGT
jgi:2-haloacid dehalogenase